MKNKLHILLSSIISLLLVIGTVTYSNKVEVKAAISDPARNAAYQQYFACIGPEMTAFLLALLDAQANGTLTPDIGLLAPALNMTSDTYDLALDSISSVLDHENLVGMTGNIYNTSFSNNLMQYIQDNGIASLPKPVYITETGNTLAYTQSGGSKQDIIDQIKLVLDTYPSQIAGLTLFNPFASNPGFKHHEWTPEELKRLCSTVDCSKVGVNYGTVYNDGNFQDAAKYNFGYAVTIIDASKTNPQALATAINDFTGNNPNKKVILRLGVGESGLGFEEPSSVIGFMNQLARAGVKPGAALLIGGPNEPDQGEAWLNPECLQFIREYLNLGAWCTEQYNVMPVYYRPEVVGHNREKPWILWSTISDYDDTGDVENLANVLESDFIISAPEYNHDDFELISRQMTGALQSSTDLNYKKRWSIRNPDTDEIDNRVNIPLFNSVHRGTKVINSYGIKSQIGFDEVNGEKPEDYLNRMLKTSVNDKNGAEDGEEFGWLTDMPAIEFRGCLQRATCDPKREKCLSIALNNGYCDPTEENPANCIGVGYTFSLFGEMSHQEPSDLHSISRAYGVSKSMLVDRPDKVIGYYDIFSDKDIQAGMALSNPTYGMDYYSLYRNGNLTEESYAKGNENALAMVSNMYQDKSKNLAENTRPSGGDSNINPLKPTNANAQGLAQPQGTLFVEREGELVDGVLNIDYELCSWRQPGSACGIGDNRATFYLDGKVTEALSMGRIRVLLEGSDNRRCWSSRNEAPPLSIPLGSCKIIRAEAWGNQVGPEGCSKYSFNDGCEVCVDLEGNIEFDETTSCGKMLPPPPVDCRICNTWAPPEYCPPIIEQESIFETECTGGECTTDDFKVEPEVPWLEKIAYGDNASVDNDYQVNYGNEAEKDSTFAQVLQPLVDAYTGFLGILGIECKLAVTKVFEGTPLQYEKEEVECAAGAKDYLFYAYPTMYEGDFQQKSVDMALHNAMFRNNGQNDAHFIPKSTMQRVNLKLELGDITISGGDGEDLPQFDTSPDNKPFWETAWNWISGEKKREYFLGISEQDERYMFIEYFEFFQPQISGHCMKLRSLTHPIEGREVPEEQNEICNINDFWLNGATTSTAQMLENTLAYKNEEMFKIAASKGELLAEKTTMAINLNKNVIPTAQKLYADDLTSAYKSSKAATKMDQATWLKLMNDFNQEIKILTKKYSTVYDQETLLEPENWPQPMLDELQVIVDKYVKKYKLS